MCGGRCTTCKKVFTQPGSFEMHSCVTKLRKMSDEDLLTALYKSGGCSKAYYEAEMAKLKQEAKKD